VSAPGRVTWVSDPGQPAPARPPKSAAAFRTIGEAADELDVPAHVLRFWETRFPQLRPVKRSGGRRYYRPEDIELLRRIRHWLYQDGYTIRGVQQLLENQPPQPVAGAAESDIAGPFEAAPDADADALLAADIASEAETDATRRLEPPVRSDPPREPAALDPAIRAELEAIRGELQQTRALLDDLLRPSKNS
jgi:DNA-binding transcriptional MerR regulator